MIRMIFPPGVITDLFGIDAVDEGEGTLGQNEKIRSNIRLMFQYALSLGGFVIDEFTNGCVHESC